MNEKLLAYLKERGLLNERQVEELRKEYRETKKSVREIILEKGLINEEVLIEALSKVSRIPTVKLYEIDMNMEVGGMIKPELLRTHVMIPFGFDPEDNSTLLVALNDPMNMRGRDLAAISSKCHIKPYLATTSDILVTIDRYYGTEEIKEAAELYTTTAEEDTSLESQIMQEDINSSPVVMLVNTMIEQAVRQRASDIHVEAEQDRVRVRYRVDGVLYTTATYSSKLLQAIIARLKIISGMDISEKRKPQDGRFSITVDRRDYDVRVSMLPTVYGEKCVMRLAQKKVLQRSKEELGFSKDELAKFNKILDKPNGIVLVTGPTGSGKSTTLYAALSELNSDMVNIVTVEDPVEANIPGINQVQVNPKADMTFANALRSILRQDPDIIMIGEIRDGETAAIAVQASITGHLVVSTLHTNDTASSVTRLLDMGVESYLIADSTVGIIAQRLVRRLCPNCKKPHVLLDYEDEYLALSDEEREKATVYEPVGCQRCNGTGYYGRIGIYEIMEITPTLKSMISRKVPTDQLRDKALEEGMNTLAQSARRLVLEGTTSLSEMKRISVENMALEEE
ncbi:MAG: Flp pilus assembly complex ATPase component TadA [Firmicutes bacterium]|nr:Flp pilus assembly complex ATPase component TadA [Bacillota bacterium]